MKTLLVLTVLVALAGSEFCPPPEILNPCTCEQDQQLIIFSCYLLPKEFNLKELFDNVTEVVDTDNGLTYLLYITHTSLTEIGDGVVEHLNFWSIVITDNHNLTYISPRAFGATRNYTGSFNLIRNNIGNEPPPDKFIYDLVNGFEDALELIISFNKISSIPENAFQKHGRLLLLHLDGNRISRIGSRAFATLQAPYLRDINLAYNLLPSAGLPDDAFEGIPSNMTVIRLYCNEPMTYLEQKSYLTMLELAVIVRLSSPSGRCSDGQDPYYDCDERSDWICDREDKYRPKLHGFRCRPESGLRDIWDYCDRKNTSPPPTTTTNPPITTLDPDLFSCLGRPDSVYTFPGDCGKFIICRENHGEAFECPEPLRFHPVNRHCTYPEWVDCGGSCGV